MTIQNLWNAEKSVLRRKFIAIKSYLKKEKKNLKQPNLTPKVTRERATNKPQSQWKERNHKIRAEIKETKKTIAEVNETKSLSFEKVNKIIDNDSSTKKRERIKLEMKKEDIQWT